MSRQSKTNSATCALIRDFRKSADFSAVEVLLSANDCEDWVRLRFNPIRFRPVIFLGNWGDAYTHPKPGLVRILRIMTGPDNVIRAIIRQDKDLFCFPWL